MYQWTDPDTGTPQLSGKPPYWYRGDEPGPRVYVIDNGRVVDDTGVTVPDGRRQQLREEAFLRAEQDETQFRAKLEEERRLRAERVRAREVEQAQTTAQQPPAPAPAEAPPLRTTRPESSEVEAMRALVEAWENATKEKAKQIIHD
jgi:membrane protein involved in colicin uptake